MLNGIFTFCVECSCKINRNVVSSEILKFRKGKCIKCFLKDKKKPKVEYCKHSEECRFFNAEFCIVGDKEKGWYAYTVNSDGSNKCFKPHFSERN